ncbi:uncharacterized protein LOC113229528 [Hyposmocoma kahamanoa]|uniref:uncharacterized protein LOC113229528 n=1 Tax=Hyposmocoma kahamanoa TaxID=1477025 RepID=UPI000E6D6BCB|nr:uncharacterized protein LOC113229528 [Hyposmocoma kahamanoa]
MSVGRQSLSLNTTSTSYNTDNSDDMETTKVKNHVKDLLKSRIFLGRYLERRLVDERIGYRDIVLLSAAEQELKKDLLEAQHYLHSVFPIIQWIGITDGASIGYSGICLWTEIDNQPFGAYWFQIRSIKFRDGEIILTLKCIRYITEAYLELEPILTGSTTKAPVHKSSTTESKVALSESYSEIIATLKSALSIRNVKEFLTFICALVIAVFTGSTAFINFLGNFVLALIREMSFFVKNSTPLLLGFLDFMSKIVGGFYILVAMIFKPSNSGVPAPTRRPLTYEQNRRPSVTYNEHFDPKSFD